MQTVFEEKQANIQWFVDADEPWTRYRTFVDLSDMPEDDTDVIKARAEMVAHPQVQELMATAVALVDFPGHAYSAAHLSNQDQ